MALEFDSRGQYFIIDCDIYHFYGARSNDFFSFWVLKSTNEVVRTPTSKNRYLNEPITEVIKELQTKGYKYEIV